MLRGKRKSTEEVASSKKMKSKNKSSSNAYRRPQIDSNTIIYNCAKFEKFFHYYTCTGVLCDQPGFVVLSPSTTTDSQKNLVYSVSKKQVMARACLGRTAATASESGVTNNSLRKLHLEMLIEDNLLRTGYTHSAGNSFRHCESVESQRRIRQLREKCNASVSGRSVPNMPSYMNFLSKDADFKEPEDPKRPHQFLAVNLAAMVLQHEDLRHTVAVYLVPIAKLKRTRVQFYWCTRQNTVPFSVPMAKWMLKNYWLKYKCRPSVHTLDNQMRHTSSSAYSVRGLVAHNVNQRASSDDNNAETDSATPPPPSDENETMQNSDSEDEWQVQRDTINDTDFQMLRQWIRDLSNGNITLNEQAPPPRTQTLSNDADRKSKKRKKYMRGDYCCIEAMVTNIADEIAIPNDQFSEAAYISFDWTQQMHLRALLDDTLCLPKEYVNYIRQNGCTYDKDVFYTTRDMSHVSSNVLYTFEYYTADLARFCAEKNLDVEDWLSSNNDSWQQQKQQQQTNLSYVHQNLPIMRCFFNTSDLRKINLHIQDALKNSGLVVFPNRNCSSYTDIDDDCEVDLEYAMRNAHVSHRDCFSLDANLTVLSVQLIVGSLLNKVAELEAQTIEPYEFLPLTYHNDKQNPYDTQEYAAGDERVVLSQQQTAALLFLLRRQQYGIGIKSHKICTTIYVASTSWRYDISTGQFLHVANVASPDTRPEKKRRLSDALVESVKQFDKTTRIAANGQAEAYLVEAVDINAQKQQEDCTIDFDLVSKQRRHFTECNKFFKTVMLCGGPDSGKRTTVAALIVHNTCPMWTRYDCAENNQRTEFMRHEPIGLSGPLSELSLVHFVHQLWTMHLQDELLESNSSIRQAEVGQVPDDNVAELGMRVYDRCVSLSSIHRLYGQSHLDGTNLCVSQILQELWLSHRMLPTHKKAISHPKRSSEKLFRNALQTIYKESENINLHDRQWAQNINLPSRATLIVCNETDISKWLQAFRVYSRQTYEPTHTDRSENKNRDGSESADDFDGDLWLSTESLSSSSSCASSVASETCGAQTASSSKSCSSSSEKDAESDRDEISDSGQSIDDDHDLFSETKVRHNYDFYDIDYWQFVHRWHDDHPYHCTTDLAIYIIGTIDEYNDFNFARLMCSDVVIVTYQVLMTLKANNVSFMAPFANNVESVQSEDFCSQNWLRCVKQHCTILQTSPAHLLLKTSCELSRGLFGKSTTALQAYKSREHVPLVAVRWEQLVVANLSQYHRSLFQEERSTRKNIEKVRNFLINARCVRQICVDSDEITCPDFVRNYLAIGIEGALVESIASQPLMPTALKKNRALFTDIFAKRAVADRLLFLNQTFWRSYVRRFSSGSVMEPSKLGHRLHRATDTHLHSDLVEHERDRCDKSNLYVFDDRLHWTSTQNVQVTTKLDQLHFLLIDLQRQQALIPRRAHHQSASSYFKQVANDTTRDLYRGTLGFRNAPEFMFDFFANATVSAALQSGQPVHMFRNERPKCTRFANLLDFCDPIADHEFILDQMQYLSSTFESRRHLHPLKPTYRHFLSKCMDMPELLDVMLELLGDLKMFQVSRQMSNHFRSSTDAPSFQIAQPDANTIEQDVEHQITQVANAMRDDEDNITSDAVATTTTRDADNVPSQRAASPQVFESDLSSFSNVTLDAIYTLEESRREQVHSNHNSDVCTFQLPKSVADLAFIPYALNSQLVDYETSFMIDGDEGLCMPLSFLEILSTDETSVAGYRHVYSSHVDKSLFALVHAVANLSKNKLLNFLRDEKSHFNCPYISHDICVQTNALNDPTVMRKLHMSLMGADCRYFATRSNLTRQFTRNGPTKNADKFEDAFRQHMTYAIDRYCDSAQKLTNARTRLRKIYEFGRQGSAGAVQSLRRLNEISTLSDSDGDVGPLFAARALTFSDHVILTASDNEIPMWLSEDVQDTMSGGNAQSEELQKLEFDTACETQNQSINSMICRYLLTEQNLLFEQRTNWYMFIQLVRVLDQFLCSFEHRELCNQFYLVSDNHCRAHTSPTEFYKENSESLLCELDYAQLKRTELENLHKIHTLHFENTLVPLVELLKRTGRVHGEYTKNQSQELQKLMHDAKADCMSMSQVLGGLKTCAPTYLLNMIVKMRHENAWTRRNLAYIKQQRQSAMAARGTLQKLIASAKESCQEELECPICYCSLIESSRIVLFPCGHATCKECFDCTSKEKFRATIPDTTIPIEMSQNGYRCSVCRYHLQHKECVLETTIFQAATCETQLVPLVLPIERGNHEPADAAAVSSELQADVDAQNTVITLPAASVSVSTNANLHLNEENNTGPLQAIEFVDEQSVSDNEPVSVVINDNDRNTTVIATQNNDTERVQTEEEVDISNENLQAAENNIVISIDSDQDENLATAIDNNVNTNHHNNGDDLEEVEDDDYDDDDDIIGSYESAIEYGDTTAFDRVKTMQNVLYNRARPAKTGVTAPKNEFFKTTFVCNHLCRQLDMLEDGETLHVALLSHHQNQLAEIARYFADYDLLGRSIHFVPLIQEKIFKQQYLNSQGFINNSSRPTLIVHAYHMDFTSQLQSGDCLKHIYPVPQIKQLLFVETPMVYQPDDRGARVQSAHLEQRLISKFANQFRRTPLAVHRFVWQTSVSQHMHLNKLGESEWYKKTRWYEK